MADALVSTPVAGGAALVAVILTGIAGKKIKKDDRSDLIPLMGVMGAFVFAAQMVNFSIPGTGSSGHIIGGVLLSSLLGSWAAFITLVSVLLIQCLIFADGGLLALGCNIINMAVTSCLIAYPLVYKPLMKTISKPSVSRIFFVSIVACVFALEIGACGVAIETELSGVTSLSTIKFLGLMTGIHFFIGIGEGLATGAVLCFVRKTRPSLLRTTAINYLADGKPHKYKSWSLKKLIIAFGIASLVIAGGISFYASENPDGLEWSILNVIGKEEPDKNQDTFSQGIAIMQEKTSIMPDYDNALSGITGALITLVLAWGLGSLIMTRRKAHLSARENRSSI